jgi:putative transposase
MIKFKNKYRIPSARLQSWDYGTNGAYFITICTDKMKHYFGAVSASEMQLNELGSLASDLWQEIANKFPYTELGSFVIMPNHVHGILIINKLADEKLKEIEKRFIASQSQPRGGFAVDKNPMLNENISRIIRWYKGRCSFEMRKIDTGFSWHSRFYDHIIRDSKSFENIQNYIENNPIKWEEDKFCK